jgi:hypothetical protein
VKDQGRGGFAHCGLPPGETIEHPVVAIQSSADTFDARRIGSALPVANNNGDIIEEYD